VPEAVTCGYRGGTGGASRQAQAEAFSLVHTSGCLYNTKPARGLPPPHQVMRAAVKGNSEKRTLIADADGSYGSLASPVSASKGL
jgi:hypothetical protein